MTFAVVDSGKGRRLKDHLGAKLLREAPGGLGVADVYMREALHWETVVGPHSLLVVEEFYEKCATDQTRSADNEDTQCQRPTDASIPSRRLSSL
jgi:hypothetical protein